MTSLCLKQIQQTLIRYGYYLENGQTEKRAVIKCVFERNL